MRLASRQHGHVQRAQVLEAGIGRGAIIHRLESGWLQPSFPHVYRLGGVVPNRMGQMMAAAMSFGGHAVLAGMSAAAVWGMLDSTQQIDHLPVDLLLVARSSKAKPGLRIRRVGTLAAHDFRWRHGIPVSSPARTLLDLAGTMGELELEAALSAAFRKKLVRRSQLLDVMQRNANTRGVSSLRALLARAEDPRDTRSLYERRLLALLKAAELPLPRTNVMVAGKLVDGVWPDLKLIYEFDGWRYHRDKFESDRLRDQEMLAVGHQVVRISGRQIDFKPYALTARLASVIAVARLRSLT